MFREIDPGVSDGFRVDETGNVWTSAGAGVHVIAPDGTELGRIPTPKPVGNVTFGGRTGRTLFICATDTLFAIDVGVRGAVGPWTEGR